MELKEVQRNNRKKRTIIVSCRITPEESKFLSDNDISPSMLLVKSIEELKTKHGKN